MYNISNKENDMNQIRDAELDKTVSDIIYSDITEEQLEIEIRQLNKEEDDMDNELMKQIECLSAVVRSRKLSGEGNETNS